MFHTNIKQNYSFTCFNIQVFTEEMGRQKILGVQSAFNFIVYEILTQNILQNNVFEINYVWL
jgi:hypothetical protein